MKKSASILSTKSYTRWLIGKYEVGVEKDINGKIENIMKNENVFKKLIPNIPIWKKTIFPEIRYRESHDISR